MTHDDLVKRAVKWLKGQYAGKLPDGTMWRKSGCGVAVPELVSFATEQPDAIGWYGGNGSFLVECKVSRSDFLADRKKVHRNIGCAGLYRFYLCPPEMISPDELPDKWGLLWAYDRKIKILAAPSENANRCLHAEVCMMYSLLRRVEVRGQLRRCLAPKWGGDIQYKPAPSEDPPRE
jgi:hypothetical protein